jgi:hypothetical protein
MTSPSFNSRERVDLARSFADDIFPVGQPVVVSIHPTGNFGTAKPAVTSRYLNWFGNSLAMGSAFPFPARRSNRWQRVVRYSRCTFNLGGAYGLHSLFVSLRSALQKPRRVNRVLFCPAPLRVVSHAANKAWRRLHDAQRNQARGA